MYVCVCVYVCARVCMCMYMHVRECVCGYTPSQCGRILTMVVYIVIFGCTFLNIIPVLTMTANTNSTISLVIYMIL
jgi:hypothetical protein